MRITMEMGMDFSLSFTEFEQDLKIAHQNLVLFDEIQNSYKSNENELSSDVLRLNIIKETVQSLGSILKKFNSDIDNVFANVNDVEKPIESDDKSQNDGKLQITHIVDAQKCFCYAIDVNGNILSQLKRFWKHAAVQELELNESLGLNDIFGIEIDMNVHRGKFTFDKTKNAVRICLIDTGEIIDAGDFGFKKLPDDIKSIPACAFLCKIERIGLDKVESLPESLKGQIYDYRIRKTDKSNRMFHLEIFSTNPFLVGYADDTNWEAYSEFEPSRDNEVNWNLEQTVNKTLQSKVFTKENRLNKSLLPSPTCNFNYDLNVNTSNAFQSIENQNANASSACSLIDLREAAALDTMNSDEDNGGYDGHGQIPISNENLLSLNANQRKANNTNDSSGAHCLNKEGRQWPKHRQRQRQRQHRHHYTNTKLTFESVRPMKTQIETFFLQSYHNQLKTPAVGEPTTIIPTCVLNAREFYGQLGRHFSGFQYFQQGLNIRRLHYVYEQYSQMPGNEGKVLVLLENGHFHRAKVLSSTGDNLATVFLLDYGTTHMISLRHIYKWIPKADEVSFQAVLFTLANVQQSMGDANFDKLVREKIPKTFVSAEITKVDDRSVSVRLFDDSGFDIGELINCISA